MGVLGRLEGQVLGLEGQVLAPITVGRLSGYCSALHTGNVAGFLCRHVVHWKYCRTLFFHCILILRFSYVENSLNFNLADTENKYFIIKIPIALLFTFHPEYCISQPGNVDILCR